MAGTNPLNNDNKTDLLFKKFQGVIQSAVKTDSTNNPPFNTENKKSITNIFQQDVFSEEVPLDLSYTLLQLWNPFAPPFGASGSIISDSSWNTNAGDQTLSYVDLSATNFGKDLPLRFYKRVYLNPVGTTGQSWWLLDPSGNGKNSTTNNLLKDTIPFLYNDTNINTYRPIVEYWDNSTSGWQSLDQATLSQANWLMDPASGILQFYQTPTVLQTDFNIDATGTGEKDRPRISFIKYVGAKGGGTGSGGSGGSGGSASSFKVGDFSGVDISFQDVSAILFNGRQFDVSYDASGNAQITSLDDIIDDVADISYYFFNKPLAPPHGDGSLNENIGAGYIICNWTNPQKTKSALPFGDASQYPDGTYNLPATLKPIEYLPFHRELCVQYKQWFPTYTLSGEWTTLELSGNSVKKIIPDTITDLYATSSSSGGTPKYTTLLGLSGGTVIQPGDISAGLITKDPDVKEVGGVAPYNVLWTNSLELGKGYQFRIFLKNDSVETGLKDPLYGGDASYNYLYIPNKHGLSGGYIELGNFGPPPRPFAGDISFINTGFLTFDIRGVNTDVSGADVSLNTQFPINTNLSLRVFYGIDVSCVIDPSSKQFHTFRITSAPSDASFQFPDTASGSRFGHFTLTGDWKSPSSADAIVSDLSWAPQHIYTITKFTMRNNTADFSNVIADVSMSPPLPIPYNTGIPLRSEIGTTTTLLNKSNEELNTADVYPTATNISNNNTNAYKYGDNSIINNIFFVRDASSFGFKLTEAPKFKLTDNGETGKMKLVGTDAINKNLAYMRMDISGSTAPLNVNYDVSTNYAVGYIGTGSKQFMNYSISGGPAGSSGTTDIFIIANDITDAAIGNSNPSYAVGGYYLNVQQNALSQRLTNVKLSTFPDICNNNYESYTARIRQYYNDGSNNFITTDSGVEGPRLYDFKIARRPDLSINYTESSYNNPTMTINNYLMGLVRPRVTSTITNLVYDYQLDDIHEWWRKEINISTDKLFYIGPNYEIDTHTNSWDLSNTKTINNSATSFATSINPKTLMMPNGSTARRYSRDYTGNQFEIITRYSNNVLVDPSFITVTRDVSFGTPGKYIWWDFTWENTTQNNFALSNPVAFFSSSPSTTIKLKQLNINLAPNASLLDFDHTISQVGNNDQLIWANKAFRGPTVPLSNKNNPYINYTGYYDPANNLKDYSGLHGTGKSISFNLGAASGNWWFDNTTNGTISINTIKFITFDVQIPTSSSSSYKYFTLDIRDDNNTRLTPCQVNNSTTGFVLYLGIIDNVNNNVYPPASQNRSYNGLQRYNASFTTNNPGCYDPNSAPGVSKTQYGKWILPYNSGSVSLIAQISIGIPGNQSISSIHVDILQN